MRSFFQVFLFCCIPFINYAQGSELIQIKQTSYEDRPHFVISTPAATYYYDIAGGGLSRMIDRDGLDWIAFRKDPWDTYPASAASSYRGIPNLVYRSEEGGAGHPGHDRCSSEIIDKNTIRSVSTGGKWKWTWTFHEQFAELAIDQVDPDHPYWFLYEGTPGGRFEPGRQYFGLESGGPIYAQPDLIKGSQLSGFWQWIYFGHRDVDRVLCLAQITSDDQKDMYSYMGASPAGNASPDGMVVFGFGRAEGAQPLLKKANTFLLGFYERRIDSPKDHRLVRKMIRKQLKRKNRD
ncbi:MAG: hypothetical protein R2824_29220 [Saprospiraceae bacterium]|nr:hypothetical protein [Lewinella sp.]